MKEGKLFIITGKEMPESLSKAVFSLVNREWKEVTISKVPSRKWEDINFNESKFISLENNQSNEEIKQVVEIHKAISVMWVVRNKKDLETVNEISERVGSLALIIGDEVEIGSNIKCLSLRIDGKSDIEEQLRGFDLPLRRETWRLARERRIEEIIRSQEI
ncbi:MAG: hypothetical protein WC784_03560 [Candidatus Shapirobacteria bacterium]